MSIAVNLQLCITKSIVDNLRLDPPKRQILLLLRRLLPIPANPGPHPVPSRDIPILDPIQQSQPLQQRTLHSLQVQLRPRPHEIQQSQPVNMRLVRRRRNDPVDRTLEIPIRPELERIGNIHRNAAGQGLDILPLPLGRFDLQRCDRLAEEKR